MWLLPLMLNLSFMSQTHRWFSMTFPQCDHGHGLEDPLALSIVPLPNEVFTAMGRHTERATDVSFDGYTAPSRT